MAIALTFDADMTPAMLEQLRSGFVASWYDPRIVSELRAAHAAATVFLTGLWAQTYPDAVAALAADPAFELENHSFDHAAWQPGCYGLPSVSGDDAKTAEVLRAGQVIEAEADVQPSFFRFPGGCHDGADVALVTSLGETPVLWDVVSGDAFQSDPAVVERTVLSRVQPGSIVIFHFMGGPNAPATAAALAVILPALAKKGLAFVTLRELLGLAS